MLGVLLVPQFFFWMNKELMTLFYFPFEINVDLYHGMADMSSYENENVVGGKLKLKGKAMDVAGGVKKIKRN